MQMYTHPCIKCGQQYQGADPDPYYCATCEVEKKAIAKRIDETASLRPKKDRFSALQEYDNSPKVRGFVKATL